MTAKTWKAISTILEILRFVGENFVIWGSKIVLEAVWEVFGSPDGLQESPRQGSEEAEGSKNRAKQAKRTAKKAPRWAKKVPRRSIWGLLGSFWDENVVKMGAKRVRIKKARKCENH